MERFSCQSVVVGAGAIGLAVARELAAAGREPIVLERNHAIGQGTSSRNSEVIHAGLYYPPGSLKARLCREGRDLLYAYCASRNIAAPRIGKLIVATSSEEESALDGIATNAEANDVLDLRHLSAPEVGRLEPQVRATAALFSPSTGILDSHGYMRALQGDVEAAGGTIAFGAIANGGAAAGSGALEVRVRSNGTEQVLVAQQVVNCAGLWSETFARAFAGLDSARVPRHCYAKGHYARLLGPSPFRHLVYPVPEGGGLGVHATLDLGGLVRFGPDVEWLDGTDPDAIDYAVPDDIGARFAPRIRAYWPAVDEGRLAPGYSGVRPKLSGPGEPPADFRIDGPSAHGVAGLVNLFGIESPGLTASLAIARAVAHSLENVAA